MVTSVEELTKYSTQVIMEHHVTGNPRLYSFSLSRVSLVSDLVCIHSMPLCARALSFEFQILNTVHYMCIEATDERSPHRKGRAVTPYDLRYERNLALRATGFSESLGYTKCHKNTSCQSPQSAADEPASRACAAFCISDCPET